MKASSRRLSLQEAPTLLEAKEEEHPVPPARSSNEQQLGEHRLAKDLPAWFRQPRGDKGRDGSSRCWLRMMKANIVKNHGKTMRIIQEKITITDKRSNALSDGSTPMPAQGEPPKRTSNVLHLSVSS